jgi:hypothetical protein
VDTVGTVKVWFALGEAVTVVLEAVPVAVVPLLGTVRVGLTKVIVVVSLDVGGATVGTLMVTEGMGTHGAVTVTVTVS